MKWTHDLLEGLQDRQHRWLTSLQTRFKVAFTVLSKPAVAQEPTRVYTTFLSSTMHTRACLAVSVAFLEPEDGYHPVNVVCDLRTQDGGQWLARLAALRTKYRLAVGSRPTPTRILNELAAAISNIPAVSLDFDSVMPLPWAKELKAGLEKHPQKWNTAMSKWLGASVRAELRPGVHQKWGRYLSVSATRPAAKRRQAYHVLTLYFLNPSHHASRKGFQVIVELRQENPCAVVFRRLEVTAQQARQPRNFNTIIEPLTAALRGEADGTRLAAMTDANAKARAGILGDPAAWLQAANRALGKAGVWEVLARAQPASSRDAGSIILTTVKHPRRTVMLTAFAEGEDRTRVRLQASWAVGVRHEETAAGGEWAKSRNKLKFMLLLAPTLKIIVDATDRAA